MEKVYCTNCKHRIANYSEYAPDYCNASAVSQDNYLHTYIDYGECAKINSNNDCRRFSPSIWMKIKKMIIRLICEIKFK